MSDYYDVSVSDELRRLRWLQEYAWMEAQNDDDVPDRREKLRLIRNRILDRIEREVERDKRREEETAKRPAGTPKPSNWGFV